MARSPRKTKGKTKDVETLQHRQAKRINIPTAEFESVMRDEEKSPLRVAYARRNRDLDPQLVWRGKDEQDWSDLVVQAPPLYIQEKVHPKVLIDDLLHQTKERTRQGDEETPDLFADFNGLPDKEAAAEFYQHYGNWSNRMILGDSLQVMASLAEREGLRGQVQCIYIDPPYGIKFNSNFQWSTTSRDVRDGKAEHITREPEQVKAFRDTWRDGIHSYLTYLRDRLTVARDLLADSGSVFVQIGDENIHRVRALLDEVFGEDNFIILIAFQKTGGIEGRFLSNTVDYVLWYSRNKDAAKYRRLLMPRRAGHTSLDRYDQLLVSEFQTRPLTKDEKSDGSEIDPMRRYQLFPLYSDGEVDGGKREFEAFGEIFSIRRGSHWKTTQPGLQRLSKANRIERTKNTIRYRRFVGDVPMLPLTDRWESTQIGTERIYVVQTATEVVKRCVLMSTDPGDLVLDPTCGSGTTAYVAEQWGRRWITIDTSRVALALARARIMGARHPWYLLADSPEGQKKEAAVTRTAPSEAPTHGDIRQGFVYERVPHITLRSIANNAEIDVIWDKFQEKLEPLREKLNKVLGKTWEEWEIPREAGDPWPKKAIEAWYFLHRSSSDKERAKALSALNQSLKRSYTFDNLPDAPRDPWPEEPSRLHAQWWEQRIARQREIDASIAAKADQEYLYDKPYVDTSRVRVAGPFTVESLSPHRVLAIDQDDELIDVLDAAEGRGGASAAEGKRERKPAGEEKTDFAQMVLDHLKTAGVQQAHKEDRITFAAITGWPGRFICAEGKYLEGDDGKKQEARSAAGATGTEKGQEAGSGEAATGKEKRAGIFVGPEFGTVARPDLVAAAREAADAGFDVLIACAFNYDAHSAEFDKLGRIPVLKARMNPDLHMAEELKNTGAGNLFVVFGEPDIEISDAGDGQIRVTIKGVDVFHPQSGEIKSSGPEGIACWFIDTDYNEESFFVRQAYFLGANDPYKALKTTLKAEIDEEAWASLHSDTSRPFPKPATGRIAVKVINHLGDEVMKVFGVG